MKLNNNCNSGKLTRNVSAVDSKILDSKSLRRAEREKKMSFKKKDDSVPFCATFDPFSSYRKMGCEESPHVYSAEERHIYFEMLKRNKAGKKAQKYMRKALRQVEKINYDDIFDIVVESDYVPNGEEHIEESLFEKLKYSCSIENLSKVLDEAINKLAPLKERIIEKVKNTSFFKYITANMPNQNDLYWLAYATTFMIQLYRSKSLNDDILCLAQFCIISEMADKKSEIVSAILPILWTLRVYYRSYLSSDENEDKIVVEAGVSEFIFNSRSNAADFITSHFMKSISSIIMILATYHFFPKHVAKHMQNWIGKIDRPKNIPEAISRITTDIGNLVAMAEKVLIDGTPISKVFLEADPILAAKAEANRLLMEGNALYFGLPQANKYDAITWVEQAQDITKVIMAMQKKLSPYETRAESLRSVCISLLAKLEEVIGRTRATKRPTPYFVIIPGLPGIGKSSLVTLIFQAWAKVKGRDFNQRHVFERVAMSEYWDGYSAEGTPYIHMSELGALKDELVKLGRDSTAIELTSIVDSLPYSLNMSKTTDKGANFCMPEILIADTNNENLNLDVMVRNLAAFKRRGVYVHATVRAENRKEGSVSLDANKKKEGQDDMDKWLFKAIRHDPVDLKKSISRDIMDQLPPDCERNIYSLMAILTKDMEEHIQRESRVNDMFKENWVMKNSEKIANLRAKYSMIEGSVFEGEVKMEEKAEEKYDLKDDDEDNFLLDGKIEVVHSEPVKMEMSKEELEYYLQRGVLSHYDPLSSKHNLARSMLQCEEMLKVLEDKNDDFFADMRQTFNDGVSFIINNTHYFASYWFLRMGQHSLLKNSEKNLIQVEADYEGDHVLRKRQVLDRMLADINRRKANQIRGVGNLSVIVNNERDIALNQSVPFCVCCPFGYHTPGKYEKFISHIQLGFKLTKTLGVDILKLLLFYVVNFHALISMASDTVQVLFSLLVILMLIFVPYTFTVGTILLLINGVAIFIDWLKHGAVVIQSDINQRVNIMTAKVATHYDDVLGYISRKQTLAVRATVGVAIVSALVIAIGGLAAIFWPNKKKKVSVEASLFKTSTPAISRLSRYEMHLQMSDPKVRIKSADEKIKTYSNVVSTIAPPACTTGTLEDFKKTIYRNVKPFQLKTPNHVRHGYALGITRNYAVINKHYIDFNSQDFELQFAQNMNHLDDNTGEYKYTICKKYLTKDIVQLDDDLVMIEFPSSMAVRDILCHIPTDYIKLDNNQMMVANTQTYVSDCNAIQAEDAFAKKIFEQKRVASYEWAEHVPGMCGLPVVCAVNGGYFVAGIHSSAHTYAKRCYLVKLSSDYLRTFVNSVVESSFYILGDISGKFMIEGTDVSSRSFTRYIDQGPVEIFGEVHHFSGNQKSNIVKSIFGERSGFYEEMLDHLPEHEQVTFKPAMMKPGKNEFGQRGNPTTVGAIKLCQPRKPLNPIAIEKAKNALLHKLISNLEAKNVARDYQPIAIDAVINGSSNDYLTRPVDKTKSAGYGYPGKKSDHLDSFTMENGSIYYQPGETLANEVADILETYENDEVTGPIFRAALKDEVRSREKYNAFKTRVFYATPFPFLIVQKAFMSPLYTLMIEHGDCFYAGLGVDMHRRGHLIKKKLGEFCTESKSEINCVEGDYGSFDTGMPYEIGYAACEISHELLRWLGYNDQQLKIVKGILTDLLRPRVDFFGDLLLVPGLQPSGKYATAEDNSIRNLLILMYIWYNNETTADKDFFAYVLPCVYGDDVVASVLDDVKNEYNNVIIYHGCMEMGLDFTTSDKGKVTNPFIDFDKISFLKRTFHFHSDLKRETACLAPSSLMKTLQFVEKSTCVSIESQMQSICLSTLTEYFFWYSDKEKFNEFRQYLLDVLNENFSGASFGFPSYDDFLVKYREDSVCESM